MRCRTPTQPAQRVAIAVITLSVLGAALAIALALFVTRFLGPFLRLHRRAEVVAAGELPPAQPRSRGTRELKVGRRSFDAMSGSLALIDRQTAALATGRLDSEALRTSMPSEAGRSIEASIMRLATVTGLLAASESRSSAILEHAAIGIWTIGIDGRIRSANAAAARLVGLDARTQRGRNAHRVPARLRRRAADPPDEGTLDPGADPGGHGAGRAGAAADRVRPRHLGAQAVRGTARPPGSPRCAHRPPQPVRRARAPRERVDERRRPVRGDVRRHRRLQERQRLARSRDRRPRAPRDRRSDPRAGCGPATSSPVSVATSS